MTQTIQQQSEAREQRARAMLTKSSPEALDEHTYLVPSQFDSTKKYRVMHLDSYSCECEDFRRRCVGTPLYCKHIKAIVLFEKVKSSYEVEDSVKREIEMIDAPQGDCCPSCQSKSLIRRGIRKTATEEKQRY